MTYPRPDYAALGAYRPVGGSIELDLSDNTNLWGPHPAIAPALTAAATDMARYPSAYGQDVQDAVAERYGVESAQVTTGCGSDDLIDAAFRAFAGPSGTVAYLAPTFSMVPHVVTVNGLVAAPVDAHWRDPARLPEPAELLRGTPDLVYACTPNNPTATGLPRDWVDALIERIEATSGTVLVLDEAYAEFSGETWLPEAPEHERVLVLRTLSKAYGAAGLRVGFAVGREALIEEVNKARGPFKVTRASEAAAAAALRDRGPWLQEIVNRTRAHRARLVEALTRAGWEVLPSAANFVAIGLPAARAQATRQRLAAAGIAVREFALPDGSLWMRTTVGPWHSMVRLLDALGPVAPDGGSARSDTVPTDSDPAPRDAR